MVWVCRDTAVKVAVIVSRCLIAVFVGIVRIAADTLQQHVFQLLSAGAENLEHFVPGDLVDAFGEPPPRFRCQGVLSARCHP